MESTPSSEFGDGATSKKKTGPYNFEGAQLGFFKNP
jgi:hypothetical protein